MTKPSIEKPAQLHITYIDDPKVVAAASTEDYARHVVPLTARSGRWNLTMTMWSILSALFFLYISVAVAQQVGSKDALIGICVAVVLFGAVNFLLSRQAIKNGLTVSMLSRRIFGGIGATIATLLFAAMAVYYAVFEGSIIAVALQTYFSPNSDIRIWYLIVVVYALPLVIGGVQAWLDKLNGALLPVYVVGIIIIVIGAGSQHGFSTNFLAIPAPLEASVPGWLWALCIYMGNSVQMMFTIDFARFGKPTDSKFHGAVSFGWVFYTLAYLVNGLVGIFLMSTIFPGLGASEQGIAQAFLSVGGWFGLLVIVVSQTRINTANYYLASTNLDAFAARAFGVRWPRIVWVGVAGVIVFLLMLTDVFSYLLTALAWQGIAVTSWVAIVLTHMALHRRESGPYEFRPGRVKQVLPGTWAMLIASVVGVAILEFGSAGAWYVLTVPIIAAVIASATYLIGVQVTGPGLLMRATEPRDEVDDVWTARIKCHVCTRSYVAVEMDRDPSSNQEAICAGCADSNREFLNAARNEARQLGI